MAPVTLEPPPFDAVVTLDSNANVHLKGCHLELVSVHSHKRREVGGRIKAFRKNAVRVTRHEYRIFQCHRLPKATGGTVRRYS